MALQDKYKVILDTASQHGVRNFKAVEQDGVLYIDGLASTETVKDALWSAYEQVDPMYSNSDLMMNIEVAAMIPGARAKVMTKSSNLNIRKQPSTESGIVGKAKHHGHVTLIAKADDKWWQIRTDEGVVGFCYGDYLSAEG
jgi:uncharacterized protein YgiM (DUF1202 family)